MYSIAEGEDVPSAGRSEMIQHDRRMSSGPQRLPLYRSENVVMGPQGGLSSLIRRISKLSLLARKAVLASCPKGAYVMKEWPGPLKKERWEGKVEGMRARALGALVLTCSLSSSELLLIALNNGSLTR